ncbi:uncharacterized protein LOC127284874 [Leptopilina boulardi]|uniref:uncharacterized protein LOC127284874 n=1 Tax=Leptopilina boulardi TaxID=63433 RepID=UPI0021F5EC40|nr:uncharacterized protein LOC127284874 [Leptopilina boulardi]
MKDLSHFAWVEVDPLDSFKELIKCAPGGIELIHEYNETNGLSAINRRKLVNIAVDSMVARYGYFPTSEQKVLCAKEIVKCFPKLKDPASEEGYEIFFDPETRSGYISWRLKTINRKRKGEKRRIHFLKSNVRTEPVTQNLPELNYEDPLLEQVSFHDSQRIEFLKTACSITQKHEIIAAMKATFPLRCAYRRQILENFPRFIDIPYLINLDFSLMFPEMNYCRPVNTELIFKAADILLPRNSNIKTNKETEWDIITRAYITLMKLIPPSTKARKKVEQEIILTDKLVTFEENTTSLDEIPIINNHPYIIALGKNRNCISSYYISINGKILLTDATNFTMAFDQLFKSHLVFYFKFDETLSTFYQFVQSFYYGINTGVQFTPRMREIRSFLSQED